MIKPKKYLSYLILFAFIFSLVPILPAAAVDNQIKISAPKTSIEAGESLQLEATLYYDGEEYKVANNDRTVWQSQDTTIATVSDKGKVTGVADGTVYIDVIYTTQQEELYSDQIEITVTPISNIPYSVDYSPSDGLLNPEQPIELSFLIPVEIIKDYKSLSGKNCGYKLYQEQDKTKVYLKLVLDPDYQPLFPSVTQLPWNTVNSKINNITDDFKDYIKPVGGKWQYTGNLTAYEFKSKTEQPLTLLGVYPENNTTLYNKTLMGNTGKALNSILAPNEGTNIPLVFLFNKPLSAGDISKFTIDSNSPIGGITGHWTNFDTHFDNFSSYIVMPKPIYNYAVYGYNLSDVTATMTLEPGAFKVAETGEYNTESYSITYRINPSIAESPDKSALILGENKSNKPELPLRSFKGGELKKIWEFNDSVANNRLLNSGIMFENNIVFGGKNYLYAVNHHNGTLNWKIDSGISDIYWIKPYSNSNGEIYYLDYEFVPNEQISKYQPYLIAINQDGSLKFKRKLPTTTNKTYSNIYITSDDDVIVIFTGSTMGGGGSKCYFIARYSADGELKSMGKLGDTFIESTKNPQIIFADNNIVVINDTLDNTLTAVHLPQNGTFNEFTPVWNVAKLPISDSVKVVQYNGSLFIYQYNDTNIYEIDTTNGNNVIHSLPAIKTPNIQVGPIFKDGKLYTADGNIYDIASKTSSINFTSVKIPTEWDKAEKYALLGIDDNGKGIYIFSKKINDKGSWKVQFYIGGEDWLDNNVIWESGIIGDDLFFNSEPKVFDFFIGSVILDTQHSLIKLDLVTEPPIIIPPAPKEPEPPKDEPKEEIKEPNNGGGGGATPKDPEPVEPEPKEPEIIEPITPEPPKEEPVKPEIIIPEPVVPVTPPVVEVPKTVKPKIIEVIEPEPVKLGIVKGIVRLKDGTPLASARLELHSNPRVTYTNSDGYFEFKDVPLGTHKLYLADLKFSDEKILLNSVSVTQRENITYLAELSRLRQGEIVEATQVLLTEEELEKEVVIVADISLPTEPVENKPFPYWIIPLILLLILLIPRRRRRKEEEEEETQITN